MEEDSNLPRLIEERDKLIHNILIELHHLGLILMEVNLITSRLLRLEIQSISIGMFSSMIS